MVAADRTCTSWHTGTGASACLNLTKCRKCIQYGKLLYDLASTIVQLWPQLHSHSCSFVVIVRQTLVVGPQPKNQGPWKGTASCNIVREIKINSVHTASKRYRILSGRGCMPPQGLLLPWAPSCAHITCGLHALGLCQSPIFTCPWVAEACADFFSASGLRPTPCQLKWAGSCIWPMLRMCACCAMECIWVMRGVIFVMSAVQDICRRHFRLFDDSHRALHMFMWHPSQKGAKSLLVAKS